MNSEKNKWRPVRRVPVAPLNGDGGPDSKAWLALETPLELVLNGRPHTLLMSTPGAEKELIIGLLRTEGLIVSADQAADLTLLDGPGLFGLPGQRALVNLPGLDPEQARSERLTLSFSTGGLSAKEVLDRRLNGLAPVESAASFDSRVLTGLLSDLLRHQPLYEQTRGVHAVALYDQGGNLLICYEDVGRHNALDKVIGRSLLEGWSLDDKLVLLSGRASLEMVIKTVRVGLPLCLCFSNPTVLAVEAARAFNLTLVGRLGDHKSLTCYTHAGRIPGLDVQP